MLPELTILRHLFALLRTRWQVLRAEPEAGYSTETVVALEPSTAYRDSLAWAIDNGTAARIPSRGALRWSLDVDLSGMWSR